MTNPVDEVKAEAAKIEAVVTAERTSIVDWAKAHKAQAILAGVVVLVLLGVAAKVLG